MKEEDELLKNSGQKIPFMVPEGYFVQLTQKKLMNKLAGEGTNFYSARNNNYLATYQALDIYGSYVLLD